MKANPLKERRRPRLRSLRGALGKGDRLHARVDWVIKAADAGEFSGEFYCLTSEGLVLRAVEFFEGYRVLVDEEGLAIWFLGPDEE